VRGRNFGTTRGDFEGGLYIIPWREKADGGDWGKAEGPGGFSMKKWEK